MFLLLASNRDIHMEGTRMFPCSFIVNMFSFCSASKWMQKHGSLQVGNIPCLGIGSKELMVLRWNAEIKAAKLWASPDVWKISSFLCCSSSCGHGRSPFPRASLRGGTYSCWWPSVPRSFSCGKESQCRVVGLNATLRQFRGPSHIFLACWPSWVSCHLSLPALSTQKTVCLGCLVLFWSFGLIHPGEYIY